MQVVVLYYPPISLRVAENDHHSRQERANQRFSLSMHGSEIREPADLKQSLEGL